jgi:hypothetical protein
VAKVLAGVAPSSLEARDKRGRLPLHIAKERNLSLSQADFLLNKGPE